MLPVNWLPERKKVFTVLGKLDGMLPPMWLLLKSICMIEAKLPKSSLSSPPKFESLRTLPVILALTQSTPCQCSSQGSPPNGTHPGSRGKPKLAYILLIA
nr:hypothetical protein Iba_chr04cCG5910 [Ipomoea batatas]